MKKIFLLIVLYAIICFPAYSQIKEEYEEERRAMRAEMNNYIQQNRDVFNQYVEQVDKEFSAYLRQTWSEFRLLNAEMPDATPKPKVAPSFNPEINRMQENKGPSLIEIKIDNNVIAPIPVPDKPVILKEDKSDNLDSGSTYIEPIETDVSESFDKRQVLNFYGVGLLITADPDLNGTFPSKINNSSIANFWDRLSNSNYVHLIKWFNDKKTQMNLNDWGYYMLVRKTSEFINNDTNYSRMLTWFLMTKSGYKVKVAYTESQICFLFPTATTIYGLRYFTLNNVKYYAPDFKQNQIFTYEKDFPGASRVIDMNIFNALNIGDDYEKKNFRFNYKDKEYAFEFDFNKNSVEFYKDFPQCDLKIYFDASITPRSKESMLNALKPCLEYLTPTESVDFLLNFVQNNFEYKDDREQFNGKEKFYFPEENFYYPYSDCDDRAVLFSFLVKELLNLKMIGVEYPGHVATAVHFETDESGDYIEFKGEKYLMADPTFSHAPFGVTMPDYKNVKAEIIDLVNNRHEDKLLAGIWEKVQKGGGMPGDNKQTSVTDSEGNIFLTGYFQGEAVFDGMKLKSAYKCRDAFVAKFNKNGVFEWAIGGSSEGNAMAGNIMLDPDENLYISGTFEKNISFGNIMMLANANQNIFIAKINIDGKVVWLNQVPVKTDNGADYIFVSSFTPNGNKITTERFPADANYSRYGISFDGSRNIYFTASYAGTAGMTDKMSLSATADYNVLTYLKNETDKQLQDNCEKTISGLFAAIALIKTNNIVLSGKIVQEAFEKYNPGFKKNAPKIYESIGKLKLMRNDQGIVNVMTEEQKSIVFDKIKIGNDSRLKITMLPNGDARLDVLNGIKVGKAIVWFPLNYIKMAKSSGNILFDYDSDHSQVTLNMKNDMLF